MATWEDGPEYAPLTRPDHFAETAAAPLSTAAPPAPPPVAPAERPAFDQPSVPVVALETLVPPTEDVRDPSVPFDVASTSLTEATSAWSAAHWSQPTAPDGPGPASSGPGSSGPTSSGLPPPVDYGSGPWPAPDAIQPPPPVPGTFPAPGTTQWFAPPPPPAAPTYPGTFGVAAIASSLTPGLIICLVIGGIVWPLAPITFGLAFALTFQMKAGRPLTRVLFAVATALLVCVLLVGILLGEGIFSDWWELLARWAQALSWVMLVVSWIVVYRDLRSGAVGPPRNPWG